MTKQKSTRGGARPNSGPKPKYAEKTTTIARRVPISKYQEVANMLDKKLKQYQLKKIKCKK